jgi:choice-of-anchor B domain-containing protein
MIVTKKNLTVLALALMVSTSLVAQLNMTYVGSLTYNESLNDVWGYTAPNGDEYAIVGLRNGVSVVDVTDPANPVQVGYAPGDQSTWRDIKVWGNYAYVTCDQGDDGLMVIDLSNLPTGITYNFWRPELTIGTDTDTLNRAHNIWMDENGIAYLAGSNIGNRGVMFLDVATTPGTPIFLGAEDNAYAHDCYVRGDTLYTADIYLGAFSMYDISNKSNPVLLGSQTTPSLFTHNLWLNDDSQVLFTTDEKPDAYVGAYDVSDPNNITELDRFRPDSSLGSGVIPHNVHVWNDFLIISYYTDGCILVDADRPHNLIEVGNFDTYIPQNTGFNGAWGAYPYFPSGLIAVSDIGNGVYFLQPNYVRACYLEGKVTDASNGNPINDAAIEIQATLVNEDTDINGDYATGYAISGTYTVKYSATGYASKTETVTLTNGVLTIKDVQLQPLTAFVLNGDVVYTGSTNGIDGAVVEIYNDTYSYSATADANGNFNINGFFPGDYTIVAGKWGFKTNGTLNQTIPLNATNFSIGLDVGYEDDFALDLGWITTGTASSGNWERGEPVGINYFNQAATPSVDNQSDFSDQCYVTGNGGNSAGANDVDNGVVRLISPYFDLSNYINPYITYETWFFNDGGQSGPPDDALNIYLLVNGQQTLVETISTSQSNWRPASYIKVSDFVTPQNDMKLVFETSDQQGSGHIVEAAIDVVGIFDSTSVNTHQVENNIDIAIAPNPSTDRFRVSYNLYQNFNTAQFQVYNSIGQLVEITPIQTANGNIAIGEQLSGGIYFIQLIVDGQQMYQTKLIKH